MATTAYPEPECTEKTKTGEVEHFIWANKQLSPKLKSSAFFKWQLSKNGLEKEICTYSESEVAFKAIQRASTCSTLVQEYEDALKELARIEVGKSSLSTAPGTDREVWSLSEAKLKTCQHYEKQAWERTKLTTQLQPERLEDTEKR